MIIIVLMMYLQVEKYTQRHTTRMAFPHLMLPAGGAAVTWILHNSNKVCNVVTFMDDLIHLLMFSLIWRVCFSINQENINAI
jgi:hypothetical protein